MAADVLADTFWRRSSPSAALQSVYSAIHALRRLLAGLHAGEYVVSRGGFYSLAPGAEISTDVTFFRKRMEAASRAESRGDREEARSCLASAVDAYRGEYLQDDPYERWAAEERETLATSHLQALERLSRLTEAAGLGERAAEYRLRILRSDPLREDSHQALIRYYLASGQMTQAIRQYRELEELLTRELGIRPDPGTRALLEDLLGT